MLPIWKNINTPNIKNTKFSQSKNVKCSQSGRTAQELKAVGGGVKALPNLPSMILIWPDNPRVEACWGAKPPKPFLYEPNLEGQPKSWRRRRRGRIFPEPPSPTLHATRDNISRKGNPSLQCCPRARGGGDLNPLGKFFHRRRPPHAAAIVLS
jgi:hypothetical protein